jgi:hypothetical protein
VSGLDYFTSERFIHDDLLREAADGIPSIYQSWREHGRITPFAIAWPEKSLRGDDGSVIERHVLIPLEEEPDIQRALKKAVLRVHPYALLLTEQREDEVRVVFETKHGSKSWTFPIKQHGPDRVLGEVVEETDKHAVGLLWKAPSPRS